MPSMSIRCLVFVEREALRQQILDGHALERALWIAQQNLQIRRMLDHHLPTHAARRAKRLVARHGNLHEVGIAFGDRLKEGGSLGTHRWRVGRTLDVHTRKHGPIST